ncbi:MAG: diaminopimelate decarboxylase [Bdellovibrio sp.]|nr:diaminopimelate decarboxylase [Bdellovibrio sp.]
MQKTSSSPFDYFSYYKQVLTCEGVSLKTIAEKVGTPTYVYSAGSFLNSYRKLDQGLSGLSHQICFAMKSNSNLSILRLLASQGSGLDVVSGGELYRAQKAGVAGERIVFSGVGKTVQEMREGLSYGGKGIFSFNVESLPELTTLNQVASQMKTKARVALRFNPDVDPKTHPYISTGIKKNKFGMNRKEILEVLKNLDRFPAIEIKGISIHIGSQLLSLSPLADAFDRLASLVDFSSEKFGLNLEFLDLGGGLGISYGPEKSVPVSKYCELIQKKFGKKSKYQGRFKIVLEPGRQIAGNSGVLLTQVLYRKERKSQDFLIVDGGMNDLIRPALYSSHHEIVPVQQELLKGPKKKARVVGPVCESSDFFAKDRPLPLRLKEGDLLAVLSAGAYGFSMAGQYNSRPLVAEVLVQDGKFEVIRTRNSYTDLIQGEV